MKNLIFSLFGCFLLCVAACSGGSVSGGDAGDLDAADAADGAGGGEVVDAGGDDVTDAGADASDAGGDDGGSIEATTCAELGIPNCVEVWPGEERTGYEYHASHETYFFRDLSNADHFFLLMGDITCDSTCAVFGFDDGNPDQDASTVFDLNGYSMHYSAADYPSLPNNGFELWDGAQPQDWTVNTGQVEARSTAAWMPMNGDWVLYSDGAVELTSSAITLPKARAYRGYVTVGRAADTDITLEVLAADDSVVCSETKAGFFRGQSLACRFDPTETGAYRLRLRSQGYVYFDRTGLVPIADHGVAVLTSWSLSDGNANQNPIVQNLDGLSIPASGDHSDPDRRNLLELRNGSILADHENQLSFGVYLSGTTRLHLHHTRIVAQGIKSHSVRAGGEIHDNHLEVDMPWYFARENSDEENVILGGGSFYRNTAIGGQGVIRLRGDGTQIYENLLRNNAQATNHYAIIQSGATNPEIHHNVFDPIEGSGILTYTGHGYRIHHNEFYVRTAPCNVEYINEDYSTNGIRMNDYGAESNYDNQVTDNIFHIEGRDFETEWSNCMPVTTGIFYSASGANNRIHNNTFHITRTTANENAPCFALYMGGDAYNNPTDNPLVVGNTFYSNDKAIWVTTYYGDSADLWFENNTFIREENTYYTPSAPDAAIRMGRGSSPAHNVRFINNHFEGGFNEDAIHFTAVSSSAAYELRKAWYVNVTVRDGQGQPVVGAQITGSSLGTAESEQATTDAQGQATLILTEYTEAGDMTPDGTHDRQPVTPHLIRAESGGQSAEQEVDVSTELNLDMVVN